MKALMSAMALIAACLWLGPAWADQGDRNTGTWIVSGFRVSIDHEDKGDRLTLFQGRRKLMEHLGGRLFLSPGNLFGQGESYKPYEPGRDILGIGSPVLVIRDLSGGAHCCESVLIVVLRKKPVMLPPIEGLNFPVSLREMPDEKALVAELGDDVWAYWKSAFADSPGPRVWLRFDPKAMRYIPALDLMANVTPPTPGELDVLSARARKKDSWRLDGAPGEQTVPGEILYGLTQLIYTGHIDDARKFVERSWMGSPQQMDDFWAEATACRVRRSPYWPAIAELNHLPADPPVGVCETRESGREGGD